MKIKWFAAGSAVLLCAPAYAQVAQEKFPTKNIRMLVPFAAGSQTDILARWIGERLLDSWGHQVIVDNRPSAGGTIASQTVLDAVADGHTMMMVSTGHAGNATLYSKLPYDTIKDFSGVTQVASVPNLLVVSSTLGVKTVKEFIALAKSKPGQFNFGSTGIGSGPHYGAALFNHVAAINAVHVPYRGSPESLTDLMSGRLQYILTPVLAATSLIRSGRIHALGVTTSYRAQAFPDVPSLGDALPGFEYQGWYGVLAPSKTPRPIINLLAKEITQIIARNDIQQGIANQGAIAKSSNPEAFDKLVHEEIATRRKVWKAAGVTAE